MRVKSAEGKPAKRGHNKKLEHFKLLDVRNQATIRLRHAEVLFRVEGSL